MDENDQLVFTIVKVNEAESIFRLVCHEDGQVTEIYESTIRNCMNRQLEMLHDHGFIDAKWRVRLD